MPRFATSNLYRSAIFIYINNSNNIYTIFIFDVLFEKIFGQNILGNISPDGTRIVSFFKDELVVGAFLFCFGFVTVAYFLRQNNTKYFKIISRTII